MLSKTLSFLNFLFYSTALGIQISYEAVVCKNRVLMSSKGEKQAAYRPRRRLAFCLICFPIKYCHSCYNYWLLLMSYSQSGVFGARFLISLRTHSWFPCWTASYYSAVAWPSLTSDCTVGGEEIRKMVTLGWFKDHTKMLTIPSYWPCQAVDHPGMKCNTCRKIMMMILYLQHCIIHLLKCLRVG